MLSESLTITHSLPPWTTFTAVDRNGDVHAFDRRPTIDPALGIWDSYGPTVLIGHAPRAGTLWTRTLAPWVPSAAPPDMDSFEAEGTPLPLPSKGWKLEPIAWAVVAFIAVWAVMAVTW